MLARLWWKDARQFWPIWLFLVLAAAGCQWLVLKFGGSDARNGLLVFFAVGWAALYGFAVAAAAFAGERENNTLLFLDMLPVSRRVLWGGKATFALATTLALAVAMLALAWLGTNQLKLEGAYHVAGVAATKYHLAWVGLGFAAILLEVLGWGLLWSAASGNAMIAAVLAIGCTMVGSPLYRQRWDSDGDALVESIPLRLVLFLATSAASCLLLTLGGRPRRSAWDLLGRVDNIWEGCDV